MARSFLILHGWQNHRPAGHWHHWLTDELRARGHVVAYPQLPDADDPNLDSWVEAIGHEWSTMPTGERCVVAHSLGVVAWVHAAGQLALAADRTLLVAPPGPTFMAENHEISEFDSMPPNVDGSSWDLVCSDADPCCVEGAEAWFAGRYNCRVHLIPGVGHLGLDDGYGPWPWALDWCLSGQS